MLPHPVTVPAQLFLSDSPPSFRLPVLVGFERPLQLILDVLQLLHSQLQLVALPFCSV